MSYSDVVTTIKVSTSHIVDQTLGFAVTNLSVHYRHIADHIVPYTPGARV